MLYPFKNIGPKKMKHIAVIVCVCLAAGLLAGCGGGQEYVNPISLRSGLVIVLPGIEGRSTLNENICAGLKLGGVPWAVELSDWTNKYLSPFYNLRAEERNHRKAAELAAHIENYQEMHPGCPVVLVGHSGGGAIAIWAAEALRAGVKIKGIILINVAISREYDLCKALEHTEQGIVNFSSEKDNMLLGAGTTIFATMDGKHESSAGMEGFLTPPTLPKIYDEKLFEIEWSESMAVYSSHTGGHFSSSNEDFVSRYVAPIVLAEKWNKQLMFDVRRGELIRTVENPTRAYGQKNELNR